MKRQDVRNLKKAIAQDEKLNVKITQVRLSQWLISSFTDITGRRSQLEKKLTKNKRLYRITKNFYIDIQN